MSLVLGLDGGGTKTVLAVADRHGNVVDLLHGPGLSPSQGADWEGALTRLMAQVPAARDTGVAVLGLPFHGEVEAYSARQRAVALALMADRATVLNDVQVAFTGAFAGGPGALILAGTGSMARASADGVTQVRVGGWGDLIGDEGSAYWIGARAIGCLSKCLDGRHEDQEFAVQILAALGVTRKRLITWAYGPGDRRAAVAGLARVVTGLANSGNVTASEIVENAAQHLAQHLTTAWRLIGQSGVPKWSFAGGVFNDLGIRARVAELVGAAPLLPRLPPVGGALLEAARRAGWVVDDGWVDRLATGLVDQAETRGNGRQAPSASG